MRLAVPFATVLLSAALLVGCGGSDEGSEATTQAAPQAESSGAPDSAAPPGATAQECAVGVGKEVRLRATGLNCSEANDLVGAWEDRKGCPPKAGASRSGCQLPGGYRCLGVVTDRGVSVSCARPGRSIAFTAKRG